MLIDLSKIARFRKSNYGIEGPLPLDAPGFREQLVEQEFEPVFEESESLLERWLQFFADKSRKTCRVG